MNRKMFLRNWVWAAVLVTVVDFVSSSNVGPSGSSASTEEKSHNNANALTPTSSLNFEDPSSVGIDSSQLGSPVGSSDPVDDKSHSLVQETNPLSIQNPGSLKPLSKKKSKTISLSETKERSGKELPSKRKRKLIDQAQSSSAPVKGQQGNYEKEKDKRHSYPARPGTCPAGNMARDLLIFEQKRSDFDDEIGFSHVKNPTFTIPSFKMLLMDLKEFISKYSCQSKVDEGILFLYQNLVKYTADGTSFDSISYSLDMAHLWICNMVYDKNQASTYARATTLVEAQRIASTPQSPKAACPNIKAQVSLYYALPVSIQRNIVDSLRYLISQVLGDIARDPTTGDVDHLVVLLDQITYNPMLEDVLGDEYSIQAFMHYVNAARKDAKALHHHLVNDLPLTAPSIPKPSKDEILRQSLEMSFGPSRPSRRESTKREGNEKKSPMRVSISQPPQKSSSKTIGSTSRSDSIESTTRNKKESDQDASRREKKENLEQSLSMPLFGKSKKSSSERKSTLIPEEESKKIVSFSRDSFDGESSGPSSNEIPKRTNSLLLHDTPIKSGLVGKERPGLKSSSSVDSVYPIPSKKTSMTASKSAPVSSTVSESPLITQLYSSVRTVLYKLEQAINNSVNLKSKLMQEAEKEYARVSAGQPMPSLASPTISLSTPPLPQDNKKDNTSSDTGA